MANEVVLGDLALDSRDTVLRLVGAQSFLTPTYNLLGGDEFLMSFAKTTATKPYDTIVSSDNRGTELRVSGSDGVEIVNTAGTTYYLNGVMAVNGDPFPSGDYVLRCVLSTSQSFSAWGRRSTGFNNFEGEIHSLEIGGYSYIHFNDYGDTELPSIPSGKNGAFEGGISWWKKGVDENYATSQLFKSTLTSPLTEDQNVVYTDATPYYASDDVFWNPFNQDLTYDFTVSKTEDPICAGCKTYSYSYSYSY